MRAVLFRTTKYNLISQPEELVFTVQCRRGRTSANFSAIPRPIPEAEPVTIATLFFNLGVEHTDSAKRLSWENGRYRDIASILLWRFQKYFFFFFFYIYKFYNYKDITTIASIC